MLDVRPCTIAEVFGSPEFLPLIEEYAAECAVLDLPHPRAQMASYEQLEVMGNLTAFGAWLDGALIGFIGVMLPKLLHYDETVAVSQSFFVGAAHRRTGAGLRLLKLAEGFSKEKKTPGFLVSAPLFSDLSDLLPQVGYTPCSAIFFKSFKNPAPRLNKMTREEIARVAQLEAESLKCPQVPIPTEQILNEGMYARTVRIPAGVMITGAHIRVGTMIVVEGEVVVYLGERTVELSGYNVMAADAGRKQAFVAKSDVNLTMIFPTLAKSVEEAEAEFTDEVELLQTRRGLPGTGETKCLA